MKQRGSNGETIEFEEKYMRPPTMAGLALHLGVIRLTLMNIRQGNHKYDPAIRAVIVRAMERVANWAEEALYTREGNNGARFSLEVNHGYGKEDQGGGGSFIENIIAPAEQQHREAIPYWEPEGEDE